MVEFVANVPPIDNSDNTPDDSTSGPFEGPEKLLEIWFAPVPAVSTDVDGAHDAASARTGLRVVPRAVWEDMLDIVKCKVLSVVVGREVDAYLLSESSFFVFPHKLILKTCGTTLNLLGLPRILAIARTHCDYHKVWRCFYSRKSFMFPERQIGPHREWRNEVEYLDALFDNGAAYTVGKMNGDHWLLYMTAPPEENEEPVANDEEVPPSHLTAHHMTNSVASSLTLPLPAAFVDQDYTLELLMTKLGAGGRRPFLFLEEDLSAATVAEGDAPLVIKNTDADGTELDSDAMSKAKGAHVSRQLGIDTIFPRSRTQLDSYGFEPCGYSANALVNAGSAHGPGSSPSAGEEGYYTIHVTPEEGWSYASFECNVPVHPSRSRQFVQGLATGDGDKKGEDRMPDLETLIQRVVNIFQPGHLTLTLFVSNSDSSSSSSAGSEGHVAGLEDTKEVLHDDHHEEPTSVEIAQRAFRHALLPRGYRRTDKINYEFGDYDLAFATFAKK